MQNFYLKLRGKNSEKIAKSCQGISLDKRDYPASRLADLKFATFLQKIKNGGTPKF